jgi:hypothetical protein
MVKRGSLFGLLLLSSWGWCSTTYPRMGLVIPGFGDPNWDVQLRNDAQIIDTSACVQGSTNTFTGSNNFTMPILMSGNLGLYMNSSNSTAFGGGAGNVAGSVGNTGFGFGSLGHITSGTDNTVIGNNALSQVTTGLGNNAFGLQSLFVLTSGYNNEAMGFAALAQNISGNSNVAIGDSAGYQEYGSHNVYIGASAGPSTPSTLFDAVAIGNNAVVSSSFTMQLGGSGFDSVTVNTSTMTISSATITTLFVSSVTARASLYGLGSVVQVVTSSVTASSATAVNSQYILTNLSATITPIKQTDLMILLASTSANDGTLAAIVEVSFLRGLTNIGPTGGVTGWQQAVGGASTPISPIAWDLPNTTSPTTYEVAVRSSAGTTTFNDIPGGAQMMIVEIGR